MTQDFTWFFVKYVKDDTEDLPFSGEGAFAWISESKYTPQEGQQSLDKLKYLKTKHHTDKAPSKTLCAFCGNRTLRMNKRGRCGLCHVNVKARREMNNMHRKNSTRLTDQS